MSPPSATEPNGSSDARLTNVVGTPSIANIMARREKAVKLPGGVAPPTNSDMYKGPQSGRPAAKRWDHLLSEETKSRQASTLKGAAKYLTNPGLISLGGGLPSSDYFPIERIDIKVPKAPFFSEEETKESGVVVTAGKHDIAEGKSAFDLHVALNYGQGIGSPQMLRFVTEHTEIVHNPPYRDWRCAMTIGSTSSLDMAFRMFTKPGEFVMTEEYTFSSAVETGRAMGLRAIAVKMDTEGLLPQAMDEILTNWDIKIRGAKKPALLYTVPSGQNPTGATQGSQRRRDIYRVAQKHDVLIIEDEPYYFLQMQPYTGAGAPDAPLPASHADFLKALVPSLLSMDVDGRVMRLDSFSKVIAPGSRVGWITATEQIIELYTRHSDYSTQNPSGISQIVLFKLLDETWGHAGYFDWLINLRLQYTKRRDIILAACEAYLPREVASWEPPMAGMFHWMRIKWEKHPDAATKPLLDIEEQIYHAAIDAGVLVIRGSWFRAEGDVGDDLFFRATYAAATSENISEAIRRFGDALRGVFGLAKSAVVVEPKVKTLESAKDGDELVPLA